mmetsp:Transcript_21419/g.47491  ORF Transcript_21419/g.47491 Transcript_21419/m.47491 type:complete len:287 (-) Transcript_21419:261-1121(-)
MASAALDPDISGSAAATPQCTEEVPETAASSRAMCRSCDRPASVCLCSCLPTEPLRCPCEVVLLQHPKERRQKNRSAWIAERCIDGLQCVVGRRLVERSAAPPSLHPLWDAPEACAVVYPCGDARPLEEIAGHVKLLLFIDATWRFAQEMLVSSPVLLPVTKVELRPMPGVKPQFLVRKPLQLSAGQAAPGPGRSSIAAERLAGKAAAAADDAPRCAGGSSDEGLTEPCAPVKWGFCTAEAVAIAVDVVCAARAQGCEQGCPQPAPGPGQGQIVSGAAKVKPGQKK